MRRPTVLLLSFAFSIFPVASRAASPTEIAPGVTLPADDDGVVFAFVPDVASAQLQRIQPHEAVLASHAAANVLRSMAYMGPHMKAELDKPHADAEVGSDKAVFYVRLNGDDPEIQLSRVHLLWLQPNKKRREITDFSMNIFGGQRARNVDEVLCDITKVGDTNWAKVIPREPLLPGEFGVVFMPKDVNQQPEIVYDFSVPGTASAAPNPYVAGAPPKQQ